MKINTFDVSNYGILKTKNKKTNNPITLNTPSVKSQNTNLSNFNNNQINFARKWSDHKSWGAVVNPDTKEVTFKIFTCPDAKSVTVETTNNSGEKHIFDLKNKGKGIFETAKAISPELVKDGDKYSYIIEKKDGTKVKVKDPYSFKQEQLSEESVIYDQSKYKWHDKDWFSDDNKERITNANLNEAVIYELNTASFSESGDFQGLIDKLDEIKENGFNAIEIMPVENTYSFNWGYDGVDKFAVSDYLGGPDNFKKVVDKAHNLGLNVIIDMVPNHHGPDGSQLGITGPYFDGSTGWGDAYRYEGENSEYVRDFMVNAALNWINNYHCDGIRFDMTKFMKSDYAMQQIRAEIAYHNPKAFTIAEDSRDKVDSNGITFWDDAKIKHDRRVMTKLKDEDYAKGKDEKAHEKAIEKIIQNKTPLARLGYDSEWDFNYGHIIQKHLYGDIDLDSLVDACIQGENRVRCITTHDDIGNLDGVRAIAKMLVPMFHLNENMILNDKDIERARDYANLKHSDFNSARQDIIYQKAQAAAEKIAKMYTEGELDKYIENNDSKALYNEKLKPLGISENAYMPPERITYAYNSAFNTFKAAQALTFMQNGPKMIFQGDEKASLVSFRFFRQFESIPYENNLYIEKGYEPGLSALQNSKIDSLELSDKGKEYEKGCNNLIKDLIKLIKENKAASNGKIVEKDVVKHPNSKVVALHIADNKTNNNLYTITNFSNAKYPRFDADRYYISFPKGKWVEILNTDDTRYKGTGLTNEGRIIESNGRTNYPINLAEESTLIFKKID